MAKKTADQPPLIVSLCGTYLKPEMQSLYRQISGLKRHRTVVFTEKIENTEMFPFDDVVRMTKLQRPRLKGNFILRFWYKYVVKQWPPPRQINKEVKPYYPYDLPDLLKEHQPDLVHVYYGHKAVKYLPMLRAWGGPFIVSFHGVDVVKDFDQPGYLEKMQEVFNEAELVIARSQSLLDELEKKGCPKHKLYSNHTPIPLGDLEAREISPPKNGEWRLLQACRLVAKKGLFTTLKALPKVIKKYPKVKFVLCGKGPVESSFRDAVTEAGLEDHIEMRGWLEQEALREEFTKAHLFLHPSELTDTSDQEGVPNAMLEAMASGLPVVATLHGGIPEAVKNHHDGILVSEKDHNALADALIEILDDSEKLHTFSINAARSVRTNYGFDEQIDLLEQYYEKSISLYSKRHDT